MSRVCEWSLNEACFPFSRFCKNKLWLSCGKYFDTDLPPNDRKQELKKVRSCGNWGKPSQLRDIVNAKFICTSKLLNSINRKITYLQTNKVDRIWHYICICICIWNDKETTLFNCGQFVACVPADVFTWQRSTYSCSGLRAGQKEEQQTTETHFPDLFGRVAIQNSAAQLRDICIIAEGV